MPKILSFSLKNINPTIHLIDTETYEALLFEQLNSYETILTHFKFIPLINVEAVFISFWSGDIFKPQHHVATLLKEFYQANLIPTFYCAWNSFFSSGLLLACIDEHGEASLENNMDFILCEEEDVTKLRIFYCKRYYKILFIPGISIVSLKVTNDQPKTFITYSEINKNGVTEKQKHIYDKVMNKFQQQSKSLTAINQNVNIRRAIAKKALHLLGKEIFKYDVAPISCTDYGIIPSNVLSNMTNFTIPEALKRTLLYANLHDIIPFKRTIICYQDFYGIQFVHFDLGAYAILKEYSTIECGTSVTLNIDKYYIPTVEIATKNTVEIHGGMIFLSEEKFTVQMIKNDKLIDIGLNNIPLVISFMNGKIQIGEEAVKMKNEKSTFVIFDLLKILKTPAKDLKPNPKWGFTVTKDNENDEIFLEFDTFRGRRKASPTFLFAFFIRYFIKAIEVYSGKIPNTIVFVSKILNDNLQENFMASCKIAKLDTNNVQIHEYKIVEIKL